MEFNGESENKFYEILRSTLRQDNIDLLEKYLSTVSNPNFYLNRIYDELNGQKCTLLMIACLNDQENMIHMLVDHFKPDLEIPNDIFLDEICIGQKMYLDVSILWAAVANNKFSIVKLLIEHGANVNYRTKTKSTPLRCTGRHGNIDMVRYLIKNGADVYATNENNETILMVCANYGHVPMVTYLIEELHCDINACDNDGRSVLYDAVHCESLEIIELLIRHGARNFRATIDQMSPLMRAAEKGRVDLVKAIASHCSLIEQIEVEELLGSVYICAQELTTPDFEQAFQCFYRALELRITHNLPKALRLTSIEIFDNRQECQTIEELKEFQYDFDYLYTEALLIRERLFGSANKKYRDSLTYRGALLADNGHHHKALMFWMYELQLCQQHSILFDPNQLREIISLISEMLLQSISINSNDLITLLALITDELERNKRQFNYNLHTILFLITITAKFLEKSIVNEADCRTLYRHILKINRCQHKTSDHNLSLLHLSLDNHTTVDDYYLKRICQYPCLQTARILLQCGADVNANDIIGNTPLHVFVSNDESIGNESILKLLCDAGAHLDYVNALRETPFDLVINPIIEQLLKNRMCLSLKCLSAQFIQKNNVEYHGKLSTSLVNFVEKH